MLGYAAILVASLLWSLNPAVVSRFRSFIKPVVFTAAQAVFALLSLLPVALLSEADVWSVPLYAVPVIYLSAITGPGLGNAFYTRSIQLVGGSAAVPVSYTYIFVAQALSVLTLGEPFRYTVTLGSITALLGIAVSVLGEREGPRLDPRGLAYAATAALLWGVSTVTIGIALACTGALSLTLVRLLMVAATFLPIGFALEGPPGRTRLSTFLAVSSLTGALSWGAGMYLFIYSIGAIGVSATVVATALTPVLSQALVRLVAGERPGLKQLAGALLVSSGIALSMV